jgi:hypothetical protein
VVRLTELAEWRKYWATAAPHLRVAEVGWVIWRDYAVVSGRSCVRHVLAECPAVDENGKRWRVRVYVRPSVFSLSNEAFVAAAEAELWGKYGVIPLAERYAEVAHTEYHARRQARAILRA